MLLDAVTQLGAPQFAVKGAEKSGVRLKVVWKVYNPLSKEVATFPYPEREKAEKKAAELTKKHGKEYTVRDDKVPME